MAGISKPFSGEGRRAADWVALRAAYGSALEQIVAVEGDAGVADPRELAPAVEHLLEAVDPSGPTPLGGKSGVHLGEKLAGRSGLAAVGDRKAVGHKAPREVDGSPTPRAPEGGRVDVVIGVAEDRVLQAEELHYALDVRGIVDRIKSAQLGELLRIEESAPAAGV